MNEQELQQAFIQFLAQKTGAKTQQELEAAIQQLGEEGLKQAYAEFMQLMQQQQVQSAKFGARLNYIKKLRGQCPDGYELQYYKSGGQLCKKCIKKQVMREGGDLPQDPIDQFKCGRKIKKKKCETGGTVDIDKCGAKMKKKKCEKGGFIPFDKCGNKMKKCEEGKKFPLIEKGKDGKNKTVYYKDEATRDSIAANKYNDQEVQTMKPGSYKKGKWTPDRTKAPYKIKKGQRGLAFYRQENKFPRGHAIISETILTPEGKNSDGTWYYPDFQKTPGRNIYVSPNGNDTVYFNYPDSYRSYDSGYQPIGNTRNQQQARARFLQLAKKSKSYDKNSAQALGRARKEK